MKKFLLPVFTCLLLLFKINCAVAQRISEDSLEKLYYLSEDALYEHDYKKSIEEATKLLREASKANNPYYEYNAYNVIGMSYEDAEDTVRAKKYYQRALERAKVTGNDTLIGWAYNNLGNIYAADKDTYQKGIGYYNEAIKAANKFGDSLELLTPYINIAWTYLENGEYSKAYPYLKKTISIPSGGFGEFEEKVTESQLKMLWGMYYAGKGQVEKATKNFEKSIEIAEKDSLFIEAASAYGEYAQFLYGVGDYKEAYNALQKQNYYEDRVFEREKIEQLEAANARFEVSEYRRNLELVQQEQVYKDRVIQTSRRGVVILIASAVIMLIILIILYRTNKMKKTLIVQLQEKNNQLLHAKEEAEKLSNLKAQFFSTVSHELRTPLYGVVGLTSLLMEDKTLTKHEADLKSLKFSADYLLALINDVLQMNKMESNLVKLEKVNFNLYDLMSGIVKSFEFTRLQNKNSIHLEIDKNIPKQLIGDSIRLSQILMNLTGNAMKFTESGNIWIIARLLGQDAKECRIYFEVRDNGVGIPEDKQQEIFEEFSQLKNSNYSYQGTGLGLPIVKRLLLLFNSEVKVSSEEGKGSSFRFEINFQIAKESPRAEELPREEYNRANIVGKRILVVDDNRINRVVTKRILEKEGVLCSEAVDGQEAIEKVRIDAYDLVLMDVNMPNVNGLEATKEIRGFNTTIPIIALTAVEIGEMRGQITAAGMNDIIVKPYDIPQFFQTIIKNVCNAHFQYQE